VLPSTALILVRERSSSTSLLSSQVGA
jgi:hypothetical protein